MNGNNWMINTNITTHIFSLQDFIEENLIKAYPIETQMIIKKFLSILIECNFNAVVKVRKNGSFTLALGNNPTKNICIVYPYKKHVRIIIKDSLDKKVYSTENIDQELLTGIERKALLLDSTKKQLSLYIDGDLYHKIYTAAKRKKSNINNLISNSIKNHFSIYADKHHHTAFIALLHDYSNDTVLCKHVATLYLLSSYPELYMFTVENNLQIFNESISTKIRSFLNEEKSLLFYTLAFRIIYSKQGLNISGILSKLTDYQDIMIITRTIQIMEGCLDFDDDIFRLIKKNRQNGNSIYLDKNAIKSLLDKAY